jgi:radical SAM-linked protein
LVNLRPETLKLETRNRQMITYRFRLTFAKREPIQYSSHLDLMRAWERSLRRAALPLAYSGGFNPRPKLQLAAALPLGHTGEAELLDAWLEKPMPVGDLAQALVSALPNGLAVHEVRQVVLEEPALQTQVVAADYRVTVEVHRESAAAEHPKAGDVHIPPEEQITIQIEHILATSELLHVRRGRQYNLRPLIERLDLEHAGAGELVLGMQLAARAGATGRPEAVLEALGLAQVSARYHRRRLLLKSGRDAPLLQ